MGKKHKLHGKYVELHWEYEPPVEYVYGHVDSAGFLEAITPWLGDLARDDIKPDVVEHIWCRWIPTPHGDNDYVIREEPERKRGCFAVTAYRYPVATRTP